VSALQTECFLLVVSIAIIIKADGKHCLNSKAVSALKIKSVHAEYLMNMNVYSFQHEMVDMHLFYGNADGNSKGARWHNQCIFLH
jgi:hypothetical protein